MYIHIWEIMDTIVRKWGNSLGIRLPKIFTKEINIEEGSKVELELKSNKIIIKPVKQNKLNLIDLLAKIDDSNLHKEIDFGLNEGNEQW